MMYLVAVAVVAAVLLVERALSARPARARDTRLRSAPEPRTEATGKTYLVIGGHGLLGSHVVEALLARGERKVRVLDVAPCGLFAAEAAGGTVETVIGSVADPATVARAVEGVDCVFLTAAIGRSGH